MYLFANHSPLKEAGVPKISIAKKISFFVLNKAISWEAKQHQMPSHFKVVLVQMSVVNTSKNKYNIVVPTFQSIHLRLCIIKCTSMARAKGLSLYNAMVQYLSSIIYEGCFLAIIHVFASSSKSTLPAFYYSSKVNMLNYSTLMLYHVWKLQIWIENVLVKVVSSPLIFRKSRYYVCNCSATRKSFGSSKETSNTKQPFLKYPPLIRRSHSANCPGNFFYC